MDLFSINFWRSRLQQQPASLLPELKSELESPEAPEAQQQGEDESLEEALSTIFLQPEPQDGQRACKRRRQEEEDIFEAFTVSPCAGQGSADPAADSLLGSARWAAKPGNFNLGTPVSSPAASHSPGALQQPSLSSSAGLRFAFLHRLRSPLVLSALSHIELYGLHPVGAGDYSCVQYTLAGMYALCTRAGLAEQELTDEVLLTILFMLEAWGSQYRGWIEVSVPEYLRLHPTLRYSSDAVVGLLKRRMAALQLQLLKRCRWSVWLKESRDLLPALAALAGGDFDELCAQIEGEGLSPGGASACSMEISRNGGRRLASVNNSMGRAPGNKRRRDSASSLGEDGSAGGTVQPPAAVAATISRQLGWEA